MSILAATNTQNNKIAAAFVGRLKGGQYSLFQLIRLGSEAEVIDWERRGFKVTESNILADTWYAWIRLEVGEG